VKKITLKVLFIGQPKLGRQSRSSTNLFEEEKRIEEKLLEETAEENWENLVSLLKFTTGC
jgi:hypothetical protein